MNAKEAMKALLAGKTLYHGTMDDPNNTTRIALKDDDLWIWNRFNHFKGARWNENAFNGDLKEYCPDTPFCACPICGCALTADGMIFTDEEGCPIEEVGEAHKGDGTFDTELSEYWSDASECVAHMGIACPCGYTFWSDQDTVGTGKDPAWFEEFVEKANRRCGL